MKILVFGLGVNGGGFAAAKYFLKHKHQVIVTDLKTEDSFGKIIDILKNLGAILKLGEHNVEDFIWADLVIKNPAILPNNKYLQYAKKISNDFSYLFDNYNLDNVNIIGVTGTKGKTTTTHAINHVLCELGYNSKLLGNMGISAFEIASYLDKNEPPIDYLVIEFSSWQLRDTFNYCEKCFPNIKIALFTNLLEDHQNTYDSMEKYLQDKLKLFTKDTQIALCPKAFEKIIKEKTLLKKQKIKFIDTKIINELINKPELFPAYKALEALDIKKETILEKFNLFKGVEHRIEWIGIKDNILFVNDSAATIPEAIGFSLSHFENNSVHIICGGTDKKLNASSLIYSLKKVKSVTLLDGTFTKNKLIPFLKDNNITYFGPYTSMKDAIYKANENAKKDSSSNMKIILLSPGSASFDLFINEFDRGNQFKKIAKEIIDK